MGVIRTIIERLKLKELFAIVFITALIITFIPIEWAIKIQIEEIRLSYQTYISLSIIIIGSYYLFIIFCWIKNIIWRKFYNAKKTAIKYMKGSMSLDEMTLLIEKYYDTNNNRFRSTAMIEFSDGRKAALESKFILYRAATISQWGYSFAYNLQPYALEFLNKNLNAGNIEILTDSFSYKLI